MDNVHFLNVEYVLVAIYNFLHNFDPILVINWILWFIASLRPLALVITLIPLAFVIYSYIRVRQIDQALKLANQVEIVETAPQEKELNEKWIKVQEKIASTNPSDWRVAILEADIMLAEVLNKAGFKGDTVGDQLKTVGKGDMRTLDDAWEAHKTRNLIAHGGSDYQLSERDASRTISLYKKVFEEFYHL